MYGNGNEQVFFREADIHRDLLSRENSFPGYRSQDGYDIYHFADAYDKFGNSRLRFERFAKSDRYYLILARSNWMKCE